MKKRKREKSAQNFSRGWFPSGADAKGEDGRVLEGKCLSWHEVLREVSKELWGSFEGRRKTRLRVIGRRWILLLGWRAKGRPQRQACRDPLFGVLDAAGVAQCVDPGGTPPPLWRLGSPAKLTPDVGSL